VQIPDGQKVLELAFQAISVLPEVNSLLFLTNTCQLSNKLTIKRVSFFVFRIVFWDVLPCKIIVDNYLTRQYIPEDNSEHHTRRRENLKSRLFHSGYDAQWNF
jgi:hypothetical protein